VIGQSDERNVIDIKHYWNDFYFLTLHALSLYHSEILNLYSFSPHDGLFSGSVLYPL
jgi:hypothetical protein